MAYFVSSDLYHNMIHKSLIAFQKLCYMLVREEGLRSTSQVTIKEQDARMLYLLGHNVSHCELSFFSSVLVR